MIGLNLSRLIITPRTHKNSQVRINTETSKKRNIHLSNTVRLKTNKRRIEHSPRLNNEGAVTKPRPYSHVKNSVSLSLIPKLERLIKILTRPTSHLIRIHQTG